MMFTSVKLHIVLRALALGVLAASVALPLRNPGRVRGPLPLTSASLSNTLVVPTMEQPIVPNRNVVWCAAFQLAWNELVAPLPGPITTIPPSYAAQVLNEQRVNRDDVPDEFVLAGTLTSSAQLDAMIEMIETRDNFHNRTDADMLLRLQPQMPQLVGPAAYGHLSHRVQLERNMRRLRERPVNFLGRDVVAFGFSAEARAELARSQTIVHDYRGPDDFVLEVRIKDPRDSLIMAKIAPGHTLSDTVDMVLGRLAASDGGPHASELAVPTLNIELEHEFMDLEGCLLATVEGRPATRIAYAGQTVRTRLDEVGVASSRLSEEEAQGPDAGGPSCIFDKPFLLMLKLRESPLPYLAMWVGHPELLSAMK